MNQEFISVIIPTYNRKESLLRTINSLIQQTISPSQFEIIIVDDGSDSYDIKRVAEVLPSHFTVLTQENQGATQAKNTGARHSRGNLLVFMDDDITITAPGIQSLAEVCINQPKSVVIGNITSIGMSNSVFSQVMSDKEKTYSDKRGSEFKEIPYVECNTQLLCIQRTDFYSLGMFQDPTGGWPNWDDVDFGYRAHLQGYQLLRSIKATAKHWDYALSDLHTACQRWQRASKSAVRLAEKCPGILADLPMFHDKGPIIMGQDSPTLILRKLARQAASSWPIMWAMKSAVPILERRAPTSAALRLFYRWVISGYIYRGYREGLRETAKETRAD